MSESFIHEFFDDSTSFQGFCNPYLRNAKTAKGALCLYMTLSRYRKWNLILEATMGFEPMNEGFADPCTAEKEPYPPLC